MQTLIDIVNDTNPYPALFGIDWEIYNHTILNFKKIILSFEYPQIRMVMPIDPLEGKRYFEPVNSEGQGNCMDQLYNIMSSRKYYINPTTDGKLNQRNVSSCTSDSGNVLENWKNMLHEVSMCRCVILTTKFQRVGAKSSAFPTYEGFPNLALFLQ